MKKVYDWDINISIFVETCKKKFSMVCSIHTNIHQVMLRTAQLLDMDCFDTKIEFYQRNYIPLRATSTLQQNDVKDGDVLKARVTRTTKSSKSEEIETNKRSNKTKEKQTDCYGLVLVCTCVEPRCVNYGKDVSVPIGTGQFTFFKLINEIKCEVCPYRDQMKNPPMIVKAVELSQCLWKIEGTHLYRGFPTHYSSEFKRCKQKRNFYDNLRRYQWQQDLLLTVKDI